MELVITFKPSESTKSNFTYTTSECRLKLCKKDTDPINTPMVEFCESLMNHFENIKYPLSLRGAVVETDKRFYIKLQQSKRHIDIDKFFAYNKDNTLVVEDVDKP